MTTNHWEGLACAPGMMSGQKLKLSEVVTEESRSYLKSCTYKEILLNLSANTTYCDWTIGVYPLSVFVIYPSTKIPPPWFSPSKQC